MVFRRAFENHISKSVFFPENNSASFHLWIWSLLFKLHVSWLKWWQLRTGYWSCVANAVTPNHGYVRQACAARRIKKTVWLPKTSRPIQSLLSDCSTFRLWLVMTWVCLFVAISTNRRQTGTAPGTYRVSCDHLASKRLGISRDGKSSRAPCKTGTRKNYVSCSRNITLR